MVQSKAESENTYVVLLRGINVGGKNMLPMHDLAQMLEALGGREVRTYIQSGNAVIGMPASSAAALPKELAATIRKKFGLDVPVIMRSAKELEAITRRNPFLSAGADPQTLHVMFLSALPSAPKVATLDANRSPPDTFAVRGRDIYLSLPNGVARTKLTNSYFDKALATTSTGRNWRTVQKLLDLCG